MTRKPTYWEKKSSVEESDSKSKAMESLDQANDSLKKAENELRDSERRFQRAMNASQDGVYDWDLETKDIYYSPGWKRMLGYEPHELPDDFSIWEKLTHPDDIKASWTMMNEVIEGKRERFEIEFRMKHKNGHWVDILSRSNLYKDDLNDRVRVVGTHVDISEIKKVERELKAREEEHWAILETAMDGFWIVDTAGRFLEVNETYCEMSGYAEEELLRMDISAVEDVEKSANTATHMQKILADGQDRFESRHRRKDGTLFDVEVSVQNRSLDEPKCLVFLRDITERKRAEDALRESEKTYRALVESIPDIVMRFDRKGRHLFVSENVRKMVDIEPGRFIGKTHAELGFPESQCRFWEESIRQVFDGGVPFETEFSFEGKAGPVIFNCRLLPERDAQGAISSVLSISRDITAHRKAEQEYQTLFREMLDGFALHEIILDANGTPVDYRFLSVNPAFERMTGLRSGDIVGRTVLEVLPDTERRWIETYGKVALTGESVHFENHSVELGKHFDVSAFRPVDGHFVCIFQDITDRKQAELALLESEARFKALHNASFGGIAIHDQGVILECNQGLSEMTGYEYSELIGMNGLLLISEKSRKKVTNNIRAGYEKPYEAFGLRKNGEEFPMRLDARNVPYRGKQVRTVEFRDLTEEKQAEAEKEKLQAQLLQAQKMESVGRLAGGVAHDFNNMLNIILGNTEMAMEEIAPDDPLHDNLGEIFSAAKRSADITRQLLGFSRKQTIAPKVLDLNDTIGSILRMLRRLIGEDIDLAWLPGVNIRQVRMDPSQIDQILANLCVNARDAIADVGKITIETGNTTFDSAYCATHPGFVAGDFVLLAVSDDGCGMDQETLSKIFEPFFSTKDVGKGTGLGLATVYGIVKQNSGFINVYSEPDQGTTFRIYLPQYLAETESPEKKTADKIDMDGNETILLVEDEPSILRMTRIMLERNGYKVLAAGTPGEAISLAREHSGQIHLLMTDVVMPEMNGRDLAKNLLLLYPNLKRLFMSGYTANVIAHHGVLDEGVQFIQKPFGKQDLAIKVREVLDEAK